MMNFKISTLTLLAVCMMVLAGCTDDAIVSGNGQGYWEGDGRRVTVSLNFDLPDMDVKSRAVLDPSSESKVNNLYVLMFKLSGENDTNPIVQNEKRYFANDEIRNVIVEANHSNGKNIEIHSIPTGTYYIASVANLEGAINAQDLREKLDNVTTLQQFQNVQVELSEAGNLSRTSVLTMSGYYLPLGHTSNQVPHSELSPVLINNSGELEGYVHLRRIDAKLHFNIVQQIPGVKEFKVKSWQMVNVPRSAAIIELPQNADGSFPDECDHYDSTIANISGWTTTEGQGNLMTRYELDFYMMENRGLSKKGIGHYGLRELEEKKDPDANGQTLNYDPPHYINAPDHSAYLVLEVEMQQTVTEDGVSFDRFAEARYVVHLGYCDEETVEGVTHKANDFKNERNTRYTYNITIIGVNDIVVEANRVRIDNHGSEGTVIDVRGGRLIDLDAHYGVFNIVLTPKQLSESHLIIDTPMGKWTTLNDGYPDPDVYTEDYQHIRIAYNHEGTLQYHRAQGTPEEKYNAVTKLVSYSNTYDYDCLGSTIPTYTNSSLIPIHHERKVRYGANHTEPLYDFNSFKSFYGEPFLEQNVGNLDNNFMHLYGDNVVRILDGVLYEELHVDYLMDDPSAPEKTPLVFTVFVNEFYYYYNNGKINHNEGYNSDGTLDESKETPRDYTMWTRFTNQTKGRTYILFTDIRHSLDNESSHLLASYQIYQRSIETYFGEHIIEGYGPSDPNMPAAMGIEQVNEHHWKNLANTNYNFSGTADADGWGKTSKNVVGTAWSAHVDQEHIQGSYYAAGKGTGSPESIDQVYNVFRSKSANELFNSGKQHYKRFATDQWNYEIVDAAMTRNRDLNRDGQITIDEVRWFAPTASQYILFGTGAGALQTKLFERAHYNPGTAYNWSGATGGAQNELYFSGNHHYAGLDYKYLVSEEGVSTGNSTAAYRTQYAGEIRCARYLGVPNGDNGYAGITLPEPVTYDATKRVFDTRGYDEGMRRFNTSSPLTPHSNFDYGQQGLNSLPNFFQMAKQNGRHSVQIRQVAQNAERWGSNDLEQNLMTMMKENYFCADYYENDDASDLGTWRIPNIVEIGMMLKYAGLTSGPMEPTQMSNPALLSCTYWFRNQDLYDATPGKTTGFEGMVYNENGKQLWRHFLGEKEEGGTYLMTMHHAGRLYNNSYWFNTRCVRDTDKDGNFVGNPEYGNPVNFVSGDFNCTYNADGTANYNVRASMDGSLVRQVSVTIDGNPAITSGSGDVLSIVTNGNVRSSSVKAVWSITLISGKVLTYCRVYQLPARYWLISHYNSSTRYATVNQNNNQTYVGASDTRDVDQIDAIYKWIITTNPSGTDPVNVADLQEDVTYYVFNAGTKQYISGPTNATTQQYMTVGGVPMTMKLIKQPNGYYVLRFNDANHANQYGGQQDKFGTWSGSGTGNHYILTPAVLRGMMPLQFTFAQDAVLEDGKVKINVSTESGAVINSVTINSMAANVTGTAGNYTASIETSRFAGAEVTTVWNVTYNGETRNLTKTYTLPNRYTANRLTFAQIAAMQTGESKTIIWGNPSSTLPEFVAHNGTSASYPTLGFTNAATLATAANNCAGNTNYHFTLTKVAGGYTLTSAKGGYSPNRNNGSVSWSTTPDVLTLTNFTTGSTSVIVEWVPDCSVRIEKSGAWININGPVYNTGTGEWVKFYFYEVVQNY